MAFSLDIWQIHIFYSSLSADRNEPFPLNDPERKQSYQNHSSHCSRPRVPILTEANKPPALSASPPIGYAVRPLASGDRPDVEQGGFQIGIEMKFCNWNLVGRFWKSLTRKPASRGDGFKLADKNALPAATSAKKPPLAVSEDRPVFVEGLEGRRMLAADLGYLLTTGYSKRLDSANAVATDSAGNTYIVGNFRARIDVDPSHAGKHILKSELDKQDIFVAKYSPVGALVWSRRFGGPGNDTANIIKVGAKGTVYIAGQFEKTADFSFGGVGPVLTSNGNLDAFVARLDKHGNVVWAGNIGGDRDDFITALAVMPGGDVAIAGTIRVTGDVDPGPAVQTITTVGVDDTFISRLSATSGSLKWVRAYGENATREDVNGLVVDAQSNIYAAGIFNRSVAFVRGNSAFDRTSNGGDDIYFAKLSASGNFQWVKNIGGRKSESLAGLARANNGDLLIAGNFSKSTNFESGSGSTILQSFGHSDVYIARYNSDADLVWARQFEGPNANVKVNGIAVDPSGNVYTTGYFDDVVDFDPGSGVQEMVPNKAGNAPLVPNIPDATDAFIAKLDAAGHFVYARQITGHDGSAVGLAIGADAAGNAYVAGNFAGTIDFDPGDGVVNRHAVEDHTESDIFVVQVVA